VLIKDEALHHCFRLYDEKAKVRFPDSMEIDVLEIPKVRESDDSQLSNWMRFFAAREKEDFEMLAQTNPAISEAWGVIKHLSADESTRMIAESREKALKDINSWLSGARKEGLQEGLQEGERKGRQEGEKEKACTIAKNLLRKKMPLDDIMDTTGLSLEEVKRLSAELS
ncbi:MAG: Rpn family recombination-promoting nuclease/putative transposase, partial [Desulfovibrio sp.]|jgi:predicted transposase/invertase (TIGR01784 family)|nr:Rpn family recombination-promoting nuclease/putative transposase [Desulfovibrio sp.]